MFMQLIKRRRSIRKFKDKAVEQEKIELLLEAALRNPSSRSLNLWEFIVVTDKQTLLKLSLSKPHEADVLKTAPLGIVVITDPLKCDVWVDESSIASTYIQFAAESFGLESCWIQIRKRLYKDTVIACDRISEILNIPEKFTIVSILAIGYPEETKVRQKEESLLKNIVHYEKY